MGVRLSREPVAPSVFRAALTRVAPMARDAWVDRAFSIDVVPDDGPELPLGCVPYLPCPVDAVLRAVDHADVQPADVFVDVGSGMGRTAALVHLLTGATVIGVEIQSQLVRASRELMSRLRVTRFLQVEGDATRHTPDGTVFFFYCPFGRDRLERVLDHLEDIAAAKRIRLCAVDLPVPPRPWLSLAHPDRDLSVYRSR